MQEGCQRNFSGRTEHFKPHLESYACAREPHVPVPPHGNFHNVADIDPGNDFDENIDVDVDPLEENAEMWDNFDEAEIQERAVMLVAGLLGSSSVVHSTVNEVVEKSASVVEDMCMYIKYKVQKFGAATGLQENDDFLSLLSDIDAEIPTLLQTWKVNTSRKNSSRTVQLSFSLNNLQ